MVRFLYVLLLSLVGFMLTQMHNYRIGCTTQVAVSIPQPRMINVSNKTRCETVGALMPKCDKCIPGLREVRSGANLVCTVEPAVEVLRNEIKGLAKSRYGPKVGFNLYPYLSSDFLSLRHAMMGYWIGKVKGDVILDLGPYTNPIHKFIDPHHCPSLIVEIEPCAELSTNTGAFARSEFVPCLHSPDTTHIVVIPTTISRYLSSDHFKNTAFDTIVCIGCDPNYGPKANQLFDSIPTKIHVFLEYSKMYTAANTEFNNVPARCGHPLWDSTINVHANIGPDSGDLGKSRVLKVYSCDGTIAPLNLLLELQQNRAPECVIVSNKPQALWQGSHFRLSTEKLGQPKSWRLCDGAKCSAVTDISSLQNNDNAFAILHPQSSIYKQLACQAELHSILTGETALMAIDSSAAVSQEYIADICCTFPACSSVSVSGNEPFVVRNRVYSCKECLDLRIKYGGNGGALEFSGYQRYRKTFSSSEANGALRIKKATTLLVRAENTTNLLEAYECASTSRALVHAALPLEKFTDGLIRRAVLVIEKSLGSMKSINHPCFQSQTNWTYKHQLQRCPVNMDTSYRNEVSKLEPLLLNLRNLDQLEFGDGISFMPYRPLVAIPSVLRRNFKKNVLLDVGANGFFGSPKHFIDAYRPFKDFDEVHMFEPHADGMDVPVWYRNKYNFSFHQISVQIGTRDKYDVLTFIQKFFIKDDYVVLKFDVDEGTNGPTMEWGFLADLLSWEHLELIDELYIEMHFFMKPVWDHNFHSMQQGFEVLSQLRECGMAVHAWP